MHGIEANVEVKINEWDVLHGKSSQDLRTKVDEWIKHFFYHLAPSLPVYVSVGEDSLEDIGKMKKQIHRWFMGYGSDTRLDSQFLRLDYSRKTFNLHYVIMRRESNWMQMPGAEILIDAKLQERTFVEFLEI